MAIRALIVQSDPEAAAELTKLFAERGDEARFTPDVDAARRWLEENQPEFALVDIHLPNAAWRGAIRHIRRHSPATRILLTSRHPDLQQELLAKEEGLNIFLRQPFTPFWLEQALARSREPEPPARDPSWAANLPRLSMPMRVRITLPYALLALLFALVGAYIVSRIVLETVEERFTNQIIETGKLAADWTVQEENRLLESLRLLSNTQGMAEAMLAGDAETLRDWVLPVAVNYGEEAIEVLDPQGVSLLSLRRRPGGGAEDYEATRGESAYAQWSFVQHVLTQRVDQRGDKFAGLVETAWGAFVYVSGPVYAPGDRFVGVILVGRSLPTLVREIREDTLAHVSIYRPNGEPTISTLLQSPGALDPARVAQISALQDEQSLTRDLTIASIDYTEILGPWEARGGEDVGLIGSALAQTFLVRTSQITRIQIFILVAAAFLLVITAGVFIANRITQPLMRVVLASGKVADGNLEVQVEPTGSDELSYLAHAFNFMVSRLREGMIYRDLLGRTVTPEVREILRRSLTSGGVRLEGQTVVATILISDIRSFTTIAENTPPDTVMTWLNEYFGELTPIIAARRGIINQYAGDSLMAIFGVLPEYAPPAESAYQACQAAVEMMHVVERFNDRRRARGEPGFITGIAVHTGPVTTGGLGSSDRMDYTAIGDTVNTASRLEHLAARQGRNQILTTSQTLESFDERGAAFATDLHGEETPRGKTQPIKLYSLRAAEPVPVDVKQPAHRQL